MQKRPKQKLRCALAVALVCLGRTHPTERNKGKSAKVKKIKTYKNEKQMRDKIVQKAKPLVHLRNDLLPWVP
jgi:hypothetical protein